MERKEFLLKSCAFCGCAGLALFTGQPVNAAITDDKEDWRVGFMQKRFSHLVDYMNDNVDEKTRTRLIEEMGHFCAQQNKDSYAKYTGNTEGFLKDLESQFIEKASYTKETGTISLLGKKQESCACAFAGNKQIAPEFCNCSQGYMKEAFSSITGRPVDVSVYESILKGNDRCSFTIKIG